MGNPAREVIEAVLDKIRVHSGNIQGVEQLIAQGGVENNGHFISASELEMGRLQDIGGLTTLLEVLEQIDIPENAWDGVIQTLTELQNPALPWVQATIEKLLSQLKPAGAGVQLDG